MGIGRVWWLLGAALLSLVPAGVLAGDLIAQSGPEVVLAGDVRVSAVAETPNLLDIPDSDADDVAIWVHPSRPELSVIVATAKEGGLYVYDLDGLVLQHLPGYYNNVDMRLIGRGEAGRAVFAASDRGNNRVALFYLNPVTRRLRAAQIPIDVPIEVYGICLYHDPVERGFYAFITTKAGRVSQWRLLPNGGGAHVRDVVFASQTEGCVADDANRRIFVGEETHGVWSFAAPADQALDLQLVDGVGEAGHLVPDVEGLALFRGEGKESGYLLASSQGANRFEVYARTPPHRHLGSFSVGDGIVDGVQETDGLDVTPLPVGERFPSGLLVVQDGQNEGTTNFKLVSWGDVAEALSLP